MPGTIAENLALFGELDESALSAAARASGFDEVLAELPDGTGTVLGNGGVGLSAGQRQRLALTRTLALRVPVLLLDEPTAHLDADSRHRVLAALAARAAAGDAVLIVAHHDEVYDIADTVIEVAAGAYPDAAESAPASGVPGGH